MCTTQSSVHTAAICLSFSLLPACLISCYSFFLSPSLRYKVTYSSNHNFLCYQRSFFYQIISNSIFYKILFTKAVHHVRDTILYPHSDHLSFLFSASACLIPCYSFFLSPLTTVQSHI